MDRGRLFGIEENVEEVRLLCLDRLDRFGHGETGIIGHHVELSWFVEDVLELNDDRGARSDCKGALWRWFRAHADQGKCVIATRGG